MIVQHDSSPHVQFRIAALGAKSRRVATLPVQKVLSILREANTEADFRRLFWKAAKITGPE